MHALEITTACHINSTTIGFMVKWKIGKTCEKTVRNRSRSHICRYDTGVPMRLATLIPPGVAANKSNFAFRIYFKSNMCIILTIHACSGNYDSMSYQFYDNQIYGNGKLKKHSRFWYLLTLQDANAENYRE